MFSFRFVNFWRQRVSFDVHGGSLPRCSRGGRAQSNPAALGTHPSFTNDLLNKACFPILLDLINYDHIVLLMIVNCILVDCTQVAGYDALFETQRSSLPVWRCFVTQDDLSAFWITIRIEMILIKEVATFLRYSEVWKLSLLSEVFIFKTLANL